MEKEIWEEKGELRRAKRKQNGEERMESLKKGSTFEVDLDKQIKF